MNKTKLLSFNANDEEFPSHEEQDEIAKGFASMSAAGFSKISLAVDGMRSASTAPRLFPTPPMLMLDTGSKTKR